MVESTKSIIFAGAGICSISHITKEVESLIKIADIVLFLVNEEALAQWIEKKAKNSKSLESIYFSSRKRVESYQKISDFILTMAESYNHMAVVVYGHPMLMSTVVNKSIKNANSQGLNIKVFPGISAYDCLLADLRLDPIQGLLAIDTTVLLKEKKTIDPTNHLVLWQLGVTLSSQTINKELGDIDIEGLKKYLYRYYLPEQDFIIYEASLFPYIPPKINRTSIYKLSVKDISHISTGYIPKVINY